MNSKKVNWLKAFLGFLAAFLVIDGFWISIYALQLYKDQIGGLLAEQPKMGIACLFYLGYAAAAVRLIVMPSTSIAQASLNGAILGAAAYGTYAVTNYAMLTGWAPSLLYIDTLWGAAVTAACCAVSYQVALVGKQN